MDKDFNAVNSNLELQTPNDTNRVSRSSNYHIVNEDVDHTEDIEQLEDMGFNKDTVRKLYLFYNPRTIDRAIEYLSTVEGKIQHNFYKSSFSKRGQCYICGMPKSEHIKDEDDEEDEDSHLDDIIDIGDKEEDSSPIDLYEEKKEEELDIKPITNNNKVIVEDEDNEKVAPLITSKYSKYSYNRVYCGVCFTRLTEKEIQELDCLECHHTCCMTCWFEYLSTNILQAKVSELKCFTYKCPTVLPEEFIMSIIKSDSKLVSKYKNFKQKSEILKCPTKKFCPEPDCQSFIEMKEGEDKYVQCELGHKYCYVCLKPWHGDKPCDEILDKDFQIWKKGKVIKQCPRCKFYTEKNEGCNHMTCAECKYMWCWLCLGEYTENHYREGKCNGLQFYKGDKVPDKIPRQYRPVHRHVRHNETDEERRQRLANVPTAIFRRVGSEDYEDYIDYRYIICLELFFNNVKDVTYYEHDGCLMFFFVIIDFVFLSVAHGLIAMWAQVTSHDYACRGLTNIIVLLTAILLLLPFQIFTTCFIIIESILMCWWPKYCLIYQLYTCAFYHSVDIC